MRYRWSECLVWWSVVLAGIAVANQRTWAADPPVSAPIANAPDGKCGKERAWIHKGFEQFSKGRFDNGGDKLYMNAKDVIEMIHRFDVNNDGYVDIILPNSHGYSERGPTWIYTPAKPGPDASFPTTAVG